MVMLSSTVLPSPMTSPPLRSHPDATDASEAAERDGVIGYEVQHAPPGVEKTIIVLPGTPGSRRVRLREGAVDGLDARVVMTERPGFGVTPPEPRRALTHHVFQIWEVADDLGVERFAVLGWSAGGSYALACGALLPDRVAVVGLASAHVSSFDRPEADGAMSSHAQMIVKGLREDPAATHAAIAAFLQPQADEYAADPAAFKQKWRANAAATWGRREEEFEGYWMDVVDDVIGRSPAHLADEYVVTNGPLGFAFEDVRVPVRAFHGTADSNVPIDGTRDLVKRLPDASLVEWEGETHFLTRSCTREVVTELASYL
jgi:pimeloyl-ACP methyl ester carboxylesterase